MHTNVFGSVSMLIAICIALLAQITTLVLAVYIYFKPLPEDYFNYLPWLQIFIIPCCILGVRILKRRERQKEHIMQNGVDGVAKIISIDLLGAGDESKQYYTFTLKAEFQNQKIEVVDAITDDTYENIYKLEMIPIRYIPHTREVIILFDGLN